jgi:N-acetylmuramoyl-L-alanine amidase
VIGLPLVIALLAGSASVGPRTVTITTSAGERRIPVTVEPRVGPLLPAGVVLSALGGTASSDGVWAQVTVGAAQFRFLLGAPVFLIGDRLYVLAAPAAIRRDTLFLPLQFLTDVLPKHQGQRFRWDTRSARLLDGGAPPLPVAVAEGRPGGLRRTHRVTIDPGHGGVDPGNPGLFFPRGIREKDVTLRVGLLLGEELRRRGVQVTMTRTLDTLIDLRDRGGYCAADCDLFVSVHVNSLPRRAGYTAVRGFETYFLAEARTEDAARVARMENESIRFEQAADEGEGQDGLGFILKDLQVNEHLRESARVAELIQDHLDEVHDGGDRGVKQAGFMVLNTARRPAVLIELGYSTNRDDARLMVESANQRRLAGAIADAVVRYLSDYERKTTNIRTSGGGTDRD